MTSGDASVTSGPQDDPACANDDTIVHARTLFGSRSGRPKWIESPNNLIIMLIAGVAVFGTVVAALQTDANARAALASRNAQSQSLLALRDDVDGLSELSYDLVVFRTWWELQRLGLLARRRSSEVEDPSEVHPYQMEAQRVSQVAAGLTGMSDLFAMPYFDAKSGYWPDLNRYWYDRVLAPRLLAGEQQVVQSDLGQAWGSKGNAYQTIITMVAVVLFLYGLALTLEGGLKWSFLALGSANLCFIVVWAVLAAVRPVPHVSEEALKAYVEGYIDSAYALQLEFRSLHDQVAARADQAVVHLSRAIALRPDYSSAYTTRGDAYTVKGEALLFSEADPELRDACFRNAVRDYRRAVRLNSHDYHTYWNLAWAQYLLQDYEQAIDAIQQVLNLAPQKQFGARLVLATDLVGIGKREQALAEERKAIEYAATHPLSSDAYYFRQAIRNSERLQAVRPQDGLAEMGLLLKESYVSLQYRGTPWLGDTDSHLSNLAFGAPAVEHGGRLTDFWVSDSFPADTEQANVLFDYEGMADGEQVVLKVYLDGIEQPFFNQVVTWEDGPKGHSERLAVGLPVQGTLFGLVPGRYRVELYVEGHLRATGEFTVESG